MQYFFSLLTFRQRFQQILTIVAVGISFFASTLTHAHSCASLFSSVQVKSKEHFEALYLQGGLTRVVRQIAERSPGGLNGSLGQLVEEELLSRLYEYYLEWNPTKFSTFQRYVAVAAGRDAQDLTQSKIRRADRERGEQLDFNPRSRPVGSALEAQEEIASLLSRLEPGDQNIFILLAHDFLKHATIAGLLEDPSKPHTFSKKIRKLRLSLLAKENSRPITQELIDDIEARRRFANPATLLSVLSFRRAWENRKKHGEGMTELIRAYPKAAKNTVAFRKIFVEHQSAVSVLKEMEAWPEHLLKYHLDKVPLDLLEGWTGKSGKGWTPLLKPWVNEEEAADPLFVPLSEWDLAA